MSYKDMFRKEQRFSFRKFSFGLASAVIANVILGGAIANSPVVHANTVTEAQATAVSERIASIPYTVKIEDQTGKVVETKVKMVSVYTVETIATATDYLTADLVPEGYAIVSGLGEVTVTEKADNIFTVKVDKVAPEAVATTTTAESATSETAALIAPSDATTVASDVTKLATPEPASSTATQPTPVTSEVAEAEVAPTASEESAKPAERTVYLSYITQYVNEDRQVVDSKGHLVAVKTTDETAKTQVTVSVSKDVPAGYELVQAKPEITLQLVEKQINVLAFVVTKKSEEEEIAESQLSNRDVLMRLSLEANLLADEALRQVAKEQAGNTELATAANETKAAAATANEVLANAAATEAELGAQIDTVRTSTQNLAAEMLKVDADGVLTAQLNTGVTPEFYNDTKVDKRQLTDLMVWKDTEMTVPFQLPVRSNGATIDEVYYIIKQGSNNKDADNQDKTAKVQIDNLNVSNTGQVTGTATSNPSTRTVYAVIKSGDTRVISEEGWIVVMDATGGTIEKNVGQTVTTDEIISAVTVNWGGYDPSYEFGDATLRKEVITPLPTSGKNNKVQVRLTNAQGQEKIVEVTVNFNEPASMPTIGVNPGIPAKSNDSRILEVLHVFGKTQGETELETGDTTAPDFVPAKAKKSFPATDPEGDAVTISYIVPANIVTYEAGNPAATTYNNQSTADTKNLGKENTTELLFDDQGRLTGEFPYNPGGLYSRIVKMTDAKGNVSYSNPFYIIAYTDKRVDDTPFVVAKGTALTENNIFSKLTIDTTSGGGPVNQSLTVPESEYTREIVGYRTVEAGGTTKGELVENTDVTKFPTDGKNIEVRVKTTNPYGQTIYNWVPVSIYKLEEIDRETVEKYTDNPAPVHAITEVGSTGTVGTVKLEGDRPADFDFSKFNLKEGEAAKLAERNLEFVKADAIGQDGTIGIIRPKDGGKVEYTGSGNIEYVFEYTYQENNEKKTSDFKYTVLFTDTQAPVMTPKSEYIRFVDEAYTISVPGTDNAFLSTGKLDGTLSVLKDGESGRLVSADLGTNTAIASELDPSGKDVSGGADNQGGNSTKFNVNITGTGPSEQGTGDYKLRVGEDNFPAGPRFEGTSKENVSLTDVKVTFVKRAKVTTPVAVVDPANLTADEKAAVIAQLKKDNKDNARLNALPDSAFTVNPDGTVSVDYSAGNANVDAVIDKVANAVGKLADTQNKAKAEIDAKLAENKVAIEAKRDAAIAEIDDNIELTDVQKEAAKNAITAVADNALKDLDTKATEAKENIDKATTVSEIDDAKVKGEFDLDSAKEAGEKAINWEKEKEEAKAAVETQLTDALEKINNNPNLSYEEKKAYFDNINATKETAIDNIDKAKDSGDITVAIEDAVKASETEVLKAAKQDALNKLEKDAAKAKEDVADNSNLTKEQLEKALEDIQNNLDKAKAAVNEAATPDAVQKEEDKGVAAIAKDVLDATKQNALNQLEKDAARAKEDVAKNPNLTKEQLEKALEGIQNDLDKAKTAINEAATSAAVQEEMNKGVTALATDVLDAAKQDAKNKIDKEAESAKTAIDASPNLTPEEKDVAKKAVEEAAKVATDAIDKATNLSDVQTAEDNGVKAIDAEELKAAQKDAKNKIAKEAESAKKAIDTNLNLTPEEKESAKKAIDTDAQAATAAIDKALTPDAVQVEEDKGVAAINLITAKADAKGAIVAKLADEIKKLEDKQAEAEKAIDASTMTNEEKAIAKKALQDVVDKGKAELEDAARVATNEIHKATTAEDAKAAALAGEKSLTDAGKKARDAVELAKDKELAKEAIRTEEEEATKAVEKLAEDTRKAIEENPNLSDEDKQAEIKKLTAAVAKTLETIRDNATTAMQEAEKAQALADLEKAKETQKIADKAAIDRLTILVKEGELEAAKRDVLNQLEKDAARAKEDIAKNPNLTKEQVDKALEDVQKDLDKAKTAINEATTPDAVQAEMDKGVAALAKDILDAAKQDAKNKIAKDAAAAKEAIDSNPNLTDEAKEAAKKAVDTDAQTATDAIDKALKPDAVQSEEDKGVGAIAKDVLDAAKQDAKNKIAKEADVAKSAIDSNPNLSDAEKEAAKKAVDADAQAATDAIDKASTPDAVQSEEDKGVGAIAKDVLDAAKQDAKNKIAKEAESAKSAIDSNPNLTDVEKEAAKKAVDTDAQAATDAIDKASTPDVVQSEEDKGVSAIATDVLDAAKQDAKNKIAKDAATAKEAIATNPNLTDAEKKTFTDAVDAEVAKANDAISVATSPADVQKEEDASVAAIAEDVLDAAKQDAKNKIAKDAAAAKSTIDSNPNLSEAEKESAKKAADTDAQAATDAIAKASTPDAVQAEEDKGVGAIAKDVLDAAKQDAKNKIAKDAATAKEAIATNPNLTDAEKKTFTDAVDAEVAKANDAISAATSPADVQKEEDAGVAAIAEDGLDAAKQDAKNKIAKEVESAKSAIDTNPNLSEAEKESAKKAVDTAAQVATDAIAKASTPDAVQAEEDKGVGAIAKDVLDAAKQDAKNKIAKEVDAAKSAIDANPNLSDAEKDAAKKAVDTAAQAATDAIAKASIPDAVQSEEDKGVSAIATDVLDAAKQDAKNKIAKEVDAAKSAIDANPNLSDAEKEASKKAVDADAKVATDAIDASTSPSDAQSAEDKGVGAIAKDVLDAAKQDAKNKIAKESDAAKSAIDTNPNLTDAEKESAKKAVDADAQAATEAIDASTSPVEAQSAEDKGVGAIAKDVLDAAKQDAKNKIAKVAESAKSAIDTNPNLTDAEKESAKKAVDADAQAATEAIDASTSPSDAQSAEDKGVGAIAKDVLDAAKQDAKNKIGKEAESAKSAIDSNPNLTDAAKEAAKSEIDKAVDEAIVLINGVRTHQELEKIKLPMAALIKPAAKVTPVVDPNNLTEKEIARIKAFLKENNNLPEGTEINVSKDASVTIKYPDGTIDLLSPVEVVKQADKTAPTVANDGKGNIVIVPSEKAVEIVVSYVDNNGKSQTVVVTKGTDGLWTASNTVVIVDPVTGQVIVPGSVIKPGTVVTAYSKDEVGNSSDSAEAEVVAVDENNSAAGVKVKSVTTNANNVEKKAKQLPNTGEEASSATSLGLVALGLGLALLAAKRRRDEEA
ncbi:DUF1542 domain-containing protein [Streptococcus suis]